MSAALLRAAFLGLAVAPATAQGFDPTPVVFAFIESGPAGCAAPSVGQAPHFDPAAFPGCWMPPSQCPPLQRAGDGGTTIPLAFAGIPPGAPCLLVASPPGVGVLVPPCFYGAHTVLGLVVADSMGRATIQVRTPFLRLPLSGVFQVAQAQLYALDVAGSSWPPVLAASQVLLVEARF